MWLRPTCAIVRPMVAVRRADAGDVPALSAIRLQRTIREHHPTEPHYYIRWVGVRPGLQRQGLGSALMRPTLERCDTEEVPAYLEASSERSAALYERLGFVHLGILKLPDGA